MDGPAGRGWAEVRAPPLYPREIPLHDASRTALGAVSANGHPRGCQRPRFVDGARDSEQGDWPVSCGRRGEKPGSVSVYPAEKKVFPGSNYDEVVNICWLNGVLSTGRLQSQPQPWKVQFSGLGERKEVC